MGSDGMRGGKDIVAAGGSVIAQDEASVRGVGHAGCGGQCRHLRGGAAAQPDRAEAGPVVFRSPSVTPPDYEYLRKLLKERSGLDLSADKQYLVESRLVPLARKANLPGIPELVAKMKGARGSADAEVVEAMTTNETFFFRDKIPFDHLKDGDPAGADPGARGAPLAPHLVRSVLHRPGARTRSRCC